MSVENPFECPLKTTQKEEDLFLAKFNNWDILVSTKGGSNQGRELHRLYKFKTFASALQFMIKAGEGVITSQNHHPRWQNTYNRVEIWLTTFDLDCEISNRDLELARSLEELWFTFK